MKTVHTDDHRLHAARNELIDGTLKPAFEKPLRAEIVIGRVREVGLGEVIGPEDFGVAPLARVHVLVTDAQPPPALAVALEDAQVEVIVAA